MFRAFDGFTQIYSSTVNCGLCTTLCDVSKLLQSERHENRNEMVSKADRMSA